MKYFSVLFSFFLVACSDETISGYVSPRAEYVLSQIDGTPYDATASIMFPEKGVAVGTAPCNTWRASQSVPYPWFELGPIASTRRACTDLDSERAYFTALAQMTLAEATGTVLILSNDAGREMVFHTVR